MGLISTYLINMLGYMIVALPIYLIARIIFVKVRKQSINKLHEVLLALFVLYIVALASQTIIPKWDIGMNGGRFYFDVYLTNSLANVNVIPFRTMFMYLQSNDYVSDWGSVSLVNLLGNMFVFSPIGIFIPLLWRRLNSFKSILAIGVVVTCFIESTQFFIGRSTDIDDIILNTVGVLIGYIAYVGLRKVWR